ncbi:uncharacterized protein LOC112052352 [Bicyclus anynana]|uniref:Uncharacterized protein LOC112052352 n=1 Tax=Bicyclus anynana TaxID=110368 RepID=A0ABM3LT77_BICAN|nr:uncharacterized protein LOC112052352 [Bicyclus anynana]
MCCHPKVLAIFCHCGLLSLTEAIHHGVPVIGMPVFGDQPRNAAAIEETGLGVQIQVDELTKETLLEKFETVLNIQFRNKVKWISKMWKDRPVSPMDTAVYWVEYTARYTNVTFRTTAADAPLYQIYNVDILFVLLTVLAIFFFTTKYVLKFCLYKRKNWSRKDCKVKKPSIHQSLSRCWFDNTWSRMTFKFIIIVSLLFLCTQFKEVQSLNILGVFPYEGKSHFFVFQTYLEELARRGHNVTVISYFPRKQPMENYHDISLADKSTILEDVFEIERSYWTIIKISLFLVNSGTDNCRTLIEDENVQDLWKRKAKFDVAVIEHFNSDCPLGLAYKLDAPVVALTSHLLLPWHYKRFGIPNNPSFVPFLFLEGGTKPTLYQRVERTLFDIYFNTLYKFMSQGRDQQILAQYLDDVPPLEQLAKEIKFILTYTNFMLFGSYLYPANVIEVNGYHVAKPKPLPEELRKFIEESEHGVIYVSFGSMLKAVSTPRDKIDAIIDALSKFPQRVIWKWEESSLPGNPKNIYLSKWLPQNDILAHPNVLAFYSHCGMLGTTEAINYGVPMVAMPIFGDQPANAAAVEESGLGVQIQIPDLTSENLQKKLKTVLDPKFRAHVKTLSKAWRDRPISPMDSAIYWTEFAARHKNFTFRAAAADVPLNQYLCLDILAVLVLMILGLIFVLKYVFSNTKKSKLDYYMVELVSRPENTNKMTVFFDHAARTILSSCVNVNSLNILGIFPSAVKTHFFVFAPYLKELADRGHNVTVISYYPRTDDVPNYHDIALSKALGDLQPSHPISSSIFVTYFLLTFVHMLSGPLTCQLLLEDENIQNLLESESKYDVAIVELFNSDCALALAKKFDAPVVGITSHMLLPWHYRRFGVPYNPSFVMFDFLKGGTKPTFFDRIIRTVLYQHINFIHEYITHYLEQNIIEEQLGEVTSLSELAKDIKVVLVYQNFILTGSTLAPPNVIEVGGYHVAKPKPLPEDLRKFIEDSEHGVIYISFGTILNGASMPKDKLQHIINALAELPQRVIWRWNKKSLPGDPKNVFLSKWLPQNDILAHPKVIAFFSHCGLLGTTEAMYHGVPIVGMPIYGDQSSNAAAIEESGLGVQIPLDMLTKEYLLQKFKIVLDPEFRQKAKKLSEAWHDRPIKAIDSAIYWTEFAAKYSNFTFRSPAADVPLYQYLCLDVIIVVITFIVINILIVKYVLWFAVKEIYDALLTVTCGKCKAKIKVS